LIVVRASWSVLVFVFVHGNHDHHSRSFGFRGDDPSSRRRADCEFLARRRQCAVAWAAPGMCRHGRHCRRRYDLRVGGDARSGGLCRDGPRLVCRDENSLCLGVDVDGGRTLAQSAIAPRFRRAEADRAWPGLYCRHACHLRGSESDPVLCRAYLCRAISISPVFHLSILRSLSARSVCRCRRPSLDTSFWQSEAVLSPTISG